MLLSIRIRVRLPTRLTSVISIVRAAWKFSINPARLRKPAVPFWLQQLQQFQSSRLWKSSKFLRIKRRMRQVSLINQNQRKLIPSQFLTRSLISRTCPFIGRIGIPPKLSTSLVGVSSRAKTSKPMSLCRILKIQILRLSRANTWRECRNIWSGTPPTVACSNHLRRSWLWLKSQLRKLTRRGENIRWQNRRLSASLSSCRLLDRKILAVLWIPKSRTQ